MRARLRSNVTEAWQFAMPSWVRACTEMRDDGLYLVRGPDKQRIEHGDWLIRDLDGYPLWSTDEDFQREYETRVSGRWVRYGDEDEGEWIIEEQRKETLTMSILRRIAHAIFGSTATKPEPISRAQLETQIAKLAVNADQRLKWKTSIVDLLKVLNVDSSLEARKELAKELGYQQGKFDGSDDDNAWLHDAVMEKLAETGGKVPDSFKD